MAEIGFEAGIHDSALESLLLSTSRLVEDK